ncbi:cyclase family protein [Ruixingdingia sedimenti]|uniref:Cyclase family protein n=1 Tax=Ruixingdingia sedimenti TaxID=3073604 RepID=A0ABU1FCQ9_9RHOB|nr:cyclase family protein [Xinfangfangia sp. LG-4]MDR5654672.1 cyclase family protein [Xinfangfangia sp. LG-4]
MKMPSKIVDISVTLDNDLILDHANMIPKIEYRDNRENAFMLLDAFPGLKPEDLPNQQGWAFEVATLSTHNGTHMDAPYHYHSHDIHGNRMMTIDEVPLDWFFRPGVKLDFRHFEDGYVVQPDDIDAELKRIGYEIRPMDIVLVNTRAASRMGTPEYLTAGCGIGRAATLHLTQGMGVRVTGIDAWGWDAPFFHASKVWQQDHDTSKIWEGHYAGREQPYCHMEKLCNLEELPPFGFTVACFPYKVKAGSGGWTRAVALFD